MTLPFLIYHKKGNVQIKIKLTELNCILEIEKQMENKSRATEGRSAALQANTTQQQDSDPRPWSSICRLIMNADKEL